MFNTKEFHPELKEEFHITFIKDDSKMLADAKERLWRQVSDYFISFVRRFPRSELLYGKIYSRKKKWIKKVFNFKSKYVISI